MWNRATGAICSVVLAVARETFGTAKRPAAWIALDRQIIYRIDKRLSNWTAGDEFFFDDIFFLLHVGVFSVTLDSRAERQSRAERSLGAGRNDQLAFLSLRAIENVARIAALAQRAVGGVVDCETVVATQTAEETRAFTFRVVTHFQTSGSRSLRGHTASAGQFDTEFVNAPTNSFVIALLFFKFALSFLPVN